MIDFVVGVVDQISRESLAILLMITKMWIPDCCGCSAILRLNCVMVETLEDKALSCSVIGSYRKS